MSPLIDARSRFAASPSGSGLDSSGGGGNSGGMEARIVRLETIIEQTDKRLANIESDARETRKELRVMFYFQIASVATILGVVAKGFGWLK